MANGREYIDYNDTLREGTDKLNRAIDRAYDADEKATQAKQDVDNTLNTVNDLIVEVNDVKDTAEDLLDDVDTLHQTVVTLADGVQVVVDEIGELKHVDEYDGNTAYKKYNIVTYNGSSYMAKQDTQGNPPTNTTYWGMLAQRGVDGTGAVSSVNNKLPDLDGNIEITAEDVGAPTIQQHNQLVQEVSDLDDTVAAHLAEDVTEPQGVHGFRVIDGKGQYYDKIEGEWKDIAGSGSGIPVGNVIDFIAKAGDGEVTLTWKDPEDVVIDGITLAKWKGTKIMMKTTPDFAHENDGVLVVDNGIRNQYAENGFKVSGLTNGQTYYFMAFPYTDEGVYTVDEANRVEATPTEQRIYGVRIDKNNSNPETRVTYIGDALGFTPMRGNNGNFSWGSWQEVFESFEIRPVVLQNRQVQYYLDPNDFTKKADGSTATLTGADGDVMIEFGKPLWWKWTDEGSTYTIEVSDKEFDGAVKHAFEVEEGYNLVPYYPLLLTQILFVIFFKSTDSQTALGRGRVDGATGYASTGGTDKKGMFYGSTNDEQIKFLGIEDYWGNKLWWIDGLVTDNNFNLLIGKGNFNDNGSGYQTFTSGVSSSTFGYIDSVQGGNEKGFIIKSSGGSATTYYADYGSLYSARVARFGGRRSDGSDAGFSNLLLNDSGSYSSAYVSARLFCASNGKIYIGAYLGTSTDGKLRSVSGTPEPTGDKSIGTFRNEARANN